MTMRATRKRKSVRARPCSAQVSNTAVSSKFKLPAKQEVLLRVKFYDNHYIGFEAVQFRIWIYYYKSKEKLLNIFLKKLRHCS